MIQITLLLRFPFPFCYNLLPERYEKRATSRIPDRLSCSFGCLDAAYGATLSGGKVSRIYETQTGKALEDALLIKSPQDAYEFLRLEMEGLEQEQLRTINLNTKNRIISARMVYQGALNMIGVRIAEVFRPAIIDNAASLIIVHNHPSGESVPSPEDVALTAELARAGQLLGIEVLDHVIIGRAGFTSLIERGLGFGAGKTYP